MTRPGVWYRRQHQRCSWHRINWHRTDWHSPPGKQCEWAAHRSRTRAAAHVREGAGFGGDKNKITFIENNGSKQEFELKSKSAVAQDIIDKIIQLS